MDKVAKDELTLEVIKKDLISYEKNMFWTKAGWLGLIIECLVLAVAFGVLTHRFWVGAIVFLLFATYPIIKFILLIIELKKNLALINQGEFTVTKDTLTNIAVERVHEASYSRYRKVTEATFFWFGSTKWRLLLFKYYPWSKTYNISPRGMMNTSVIDNEFYIVLVGAKQEIRHVYNTKFFIWNGR